MAIKIAKIALIGSEVDVVLFMLDRQHKYHKARDEYDDYKKIERIKNKIVKAVEKNGNR